MIKTTVIIPNLNGMKYLKDCLDSLCACEEERFPIIVVDDGSTDDSVAFIRENFPFVKIIRFRENKGFCKAVNAGIMEAETPYVILLNNDTRVEKGFVSSLTKAIKEKKNCFSCSAKMVSMQNPEVMDGAGDYYCIFGWAFARGKNKPAENYNRACDVFSSCGGAAVYRTELLIKLGLFDENHFAYLEDMDIGWRAKLKGYRNRFAPEAVVYHAGSGFSGSRYNAFKVRLSSRNNIYIIWKNMPVLQIVCNLPFLMAGFGIKYLFFVKKGLGKVYRKGLAEGIRLCLSEDGRKHRHIFHLKNVPAYLRIEMEILINMFRKN